MRTKITPWILVVYSACFLLPLLSISQTNVDYSTWFDQKIGLENTALFNGYFDDGEGTAERNKSYDGSQRYLDSFNFFEGSITYDGQTYRNIQLKYDLYKDELLLNLINSNGFILKIKPLKRSVDGFTINNRDFVNLKNYPTKNEKLVGFAEVKFSSPFFIFFTKYGKKRSEHIEDLMVKVRYKDFSKNLLYYQGDFYPITKQRDLIRLFPSYKTEMRAFKIHKATASDDIRTYLTRLNLLMSKHSSINE
ncbi:hypothetical protein MWU59_12710 [Flavobacteriaceae bacterium F08102]|nr:hypothetical protein [Flavobacteriaceae bacterium F08102]